MHFDLQNYYFVFYHLHSLEIGNGGDAQWPRGDFIWDLIHSFSSFLVNFIHGFVNSLIFMPRSALVIIFIDRSPPVRFHKSFLFPVSYWDLSLSEVYAKPDPTSKTRMSCFLWPECL